jgi:hypothetical protein
VSVKPALEPALRAEAARERRTLGEHLSPEHLAAYHAGELTAAEDETVRDHLALCRECAEMLLDLVKFEEFTPAGETSGLTDGEVEAAWQRIEGRLDPPEKKSVEHVESRPRAPVLPLRSSEYEVVQVRRQLRRLYALAACLLIGVVSVGFWGGRLQQKQNVLQQKQNVPRPNVVIADAVSDKDRSRGQEQEGVVTPPGDDQFVLVLHPVPDEQTAFPEYGVEIRKAGASESLFGRLGGVVLTNGAYTLRLPGNRFRPGTYQVTFYGVKGGQWRELDTLSFAFAPPR